MARHSTCNLVIIKGVVCSMSRQLFKNCDYESVAYAGTKTLHRGLNMKSCFWGDANIFVNFASNLPITYFQSKILKHFKFFKLV